jgi:hypothetical protein
LALAVPLSRFTSRVSGGFVRRRLLSFNHIKYMKTFAALFTFIILALPSAAQQQMKPLDKDIPLSEGIQQANAFFPDIQPLTEQEVIAAVKAIKIMHPDIKTNIYQIYMRIVTDRVWPKGMYFGRIMNWTTQYGMTHVDWLDICLKAEQPLTPEEREEALASLPKDVVVVDPNNMKKGGFGYRIRSRFVSSD